MRVCPPETFMLYHSNSNLRGTVKVPSKKLRGPHSWPISEVGWGGGWLAGTLLDLDLASQLVCLASGKSLPKGSTTSGTITSVSMLAWMKCESTLRFGGRRAPGARQGRVPGAITGGVCFCLRFSLAFLNISLVLKFWFLHFFAFLLYWLQFNFCILYFVVLRFSTRVQKLLWVSAQVTSGQVSNRPHSSPAHISFFPPTFKKKAREANKIDEYTVEGGLWTGGFADRANSAGSEVNPQNAEENRTLN